MSSILVCVNCLTVTRPSFALCGVSVYCVCVCVCVCVCLSVCLSVSVCVCVCVCLCLCVCLCTVHVSVCLCTAYVSVCVCVCVCMITDILFNSSLRSFCISFSTVGGILFQYLAQSLHITPAQASCSCVFTGICPFLTAFTSKVNFGLLYRKTILSCFPSPVDSSVFLEVARRGAIAPLAPLNPPLECVW